MQKVKNKKTQEECDLPESFDSIESAAEFWESHDSADYEGLMQEVAFETDIKRHIYLVPVALSVFDKVRTKARSQGVSMETFVNVILQEHA
jgi:predicted DNA binding CopG/RHH family protein